MVKKLFKHEFAAYFRTLIPAYAVFFGIALLGRLVQLFENESTTYSLISGGSILIYIVAIFAILMLTFWFGIVRFYKNLFTGEGYLTLTLPVTPAQHIWVKLLTAVAYEIITLVLVLVSSAVIIHTDMLVELFKAAEYLLVRIPSPMNQHLGWYLLEFAVVLLVSLASNILVYYTCMAIGQLFRKNRVLASIGIYFAYYTVCQILYTVLSVVLAVITPLLPLDQWMEVIAAHPYATVHIFLCALTPLSLIMAVIFFAVTHYIIRKKLNLE